MKTIAEQLADANTKIAALEGQVATLTTERDAAVKAEADGKTAHAAQVTELNGKIATLEKSVTDEQAKVATLTTDRDAQKTRADDAEKKLRLNPAIAAQFKGGQKNDVPAGGDADAKAQGAVAGDGKLLDQYEALRKSDPAKASAFWRKNEKAIQDEQRALAEANEAAKKD